MRGAKRCGNIHSGPRQGQGPLVYYCVRHVPGPVPVLCDYTIKETYSVASLCIELDSRF